MSVLPDRLSALLRTAVEDAQAIGEDDRYELDMFAWHIPSDVWSDAECCEVERCLVCMAGSTIARRLGASPEDDAAPSDFDAETEDRLIAIDCMRRGGFEEAACMLGLSISSELASELQLRVRRSELYLSDIGRAEWSVYLGCADALEAAGL